VKPLSNVAFNFNLRHYNVWNRIKLTTFTETWAVLGVWQGLSTRGLHSFTLELSLATPRHTVDLSWVTRWTEELKLSRYRNECKPLLPTVAFFSFTRAVWSLRPSREITQKCIRQAEH
jgi:hypothetical protein